MGHNVPCFSRGKLCFDTNDSDSVSYNMISEKDSSYDKIMPQEWI